jgi:hypothetical protein
MAIAIDTNIASEIEGKKIVLYTPNANGEMPNAAVKQFVPSSASINLDKWFLGYTPEIISGFNMVEVTEEIASGLQHFGIVDGTTKKYNANGDINENEAKELITLTEEQKAAQIISKKYVMVLEANRKLDAKLEAYFNNFSTVEKSTWDLQLVEAKAFKVDNSVETPVLTSIASSRGITVSELADKVLEKAAVYQSMVATMIGEKQALETKIQNAADDVTLNTILFGDLTNY